MELLTVDYKLLDGKNGGFIEKERIKWLRMKQEKLFSAEKGGLWVTLIETGGCVYDVAEDLL